MHISAYFQYFCVDSCHEMVVEHVAVVGTASMFVRWCLTPEQERKKSDFRYLSVTVINLVKNSSVWEKEGGGQGPQPVEGLRKRLFNLKHQKTVTLTQAKLRKC